MKKETFKAAVFRDFFSSYTNQKFDSAQRWPIDINYITRYNSSVVLIHTKGKDFK